MVSAISVFVRTTPRDREQVVQEFLEFRIAGCGDSNEQVAAAGRRVDLQRRRRGAQLLDDRGQRALCEFHPHEGVHGQPHFAQVDPSRERVEDARVGQPAQSGLHGVAGDAESPGEFADPDAGIGVQRGQQCDVELVDAAHSDHLVRVRNGLAEHSAQP